MHCFLPRPTRGHWIAVGLLIGLGLAASAGAAAADETQPKVPEDVAAYQRALDPYRLGLAAARKRNWQNAVNHFEKAAKLWEGSGGREGGRPRDPTPQDRKAEYPAEAALQQNRGGGETPSTRNPKPADQQGGGSKTPDNANNSNRKKQGSELPAVLTPLFCRLGKGNALLQLAMELDVPGPDKGRVQNRRSALLEKAVGNLARSYAERPTLAALILLARAQELRSPSDLGKMFRGESFPIPVDWTPASGSGVSLPGMPALLARPVKNKPLEVSFGGRLPETLPAILPAGALGPREIMAANWEADAGAVSGGETSLSLLFNQEWNRLRVSVPPAEFDWRWLAPAIIVVIVGGMVWRMRPKKEGHKRRRGPEKSAAAKFPFWGGLRAACGWVFLRNRWSQPPATNEGANEEQAAAPNAASATGETEEQKEESGGFTLTPEQMKQFWDYLQTRDQTYHWIYQFLVPGEEGPGGMKLTPLEERLQWLFRQTVQAIEGGRTAPLTSTGTMHAGVAPRAQGAPPTVDRIAADREPSEEPPGKILASLRARLRHDYGIADEWFQDLDRLRGELDRLADERFDARGWLEDKAGQIAEVLLVPLPSGFPTCSLTDEDALKLYHRYRYELERYQLYLRERLQKATGAMPLIPILGEVFEASKHQEVGEAMPTTKPEQHNRIYKVVTPGLRLPGMVLHKAVVQVYRQTGSGRDAGVSPARKDSRY